MRMMCDCPPTDECPCDSGCCIDGTTLCAGLVVGPLR
jgi:hypothetical protein